MNAGRLTEDNEWHTKDKECVIFADILSFLSVSLW